MTKQTAGGASLLESARAALIAEASALAVERIRNEIASRRAADDLQRYFLQIRRGAQ